MDETLVALLEGENSVRIPTLTDRVNKTDCLFSGIGTEEGLWVDLRDWNAVGVDWIKALGNEIRIFLVIRSWKKKSDDSKISEISIGGSTGFTGSENENCFEYFIGASREGDPIKQHASHMGGNGDHPWSINPWFSSLIPYPVCPPFSESVPFVILQAIEGILKNSGIEKQELIAAWTGDDTIPISKYGSSLCQIRRDGNLNFDKCEYTGKICDNLWLNLSDGFVGGGRPNWDGTGGTGGALDHYKEKLSQGFNYPLVVKLGTITPTSAEVYSYADDEDCLVEDPLLDKHFEFFGLDRKKSEKTSLTLTEMEVALNKEFAFDKITEEGGVLEKVENISGLRNLGNTCYLNSWFQLMARIPEIRERYLDENGRKRLNWWNSGKRGLLEISKIVSILHMEFLTSPSPASLRSFYCKNHAEFSTHRQQDVVEWGSWFMEKLAVEERRNFQVLTENLFSFEWVEKLECGDRWKKTKRQDSIFSVEISEQDKSIKRARTDYSFSECIEATLGCQKVEGFRVNGEIVEAKKSQKFQNFPPYLWICVKRYFVDESWQPQKRDVEIILPENLNLENWKDCEEEIIQPWWDDDQTLSQDQLDIINSLKELGFSENAAKKAANHAKTPEAAAEWLFTQMDDPSINDPMTSEHDESIATLKGMGFTDEQCEAALIANGHSTEKAAEWLFNQENLNDAVSEILKDKLPSGRGVYSLKGFISHIGKSVSSGHYVAHAKVGNDWVIFNDEKVGKSVHTPFGFGYLYLYQRSDWNPQGFN